MFVEADGVAGCRQILSGITIQEDEVLNFTFYILHAMFLVKMKSYDSIRD